MRSQTKAKNENEERTKRELEKIITWRSVYYKGE